MNLIDFVKVIYNVDKNLTIFQKGKLDFNSEIVLIENKSGKTQITMDGTQYFYLLEVFIANEFMNDWLMSLHYEPTEEEIAKRIFEYGINDA